VKPLCREIKFGSSDYQSAIQLREEILRKPLGLVSEPNTFYGEENFFHLGAFLGESLIACLILEPLEERLVKMRQVAVINTFQRMGIGSLLVKFSEEFASRIGYKMIKAHARESAIPFYVRLGYSIHEPPFIEVGLRHFLISKSL
jgi:GNAT superfamily N-acetyltransferase